MKQKPKIYQLLEKPVSGENIEAQSFAAIDREAPPHSFSEQQWEVVRRMIHTTGDFSIMEAVRFSANAIEEGIRALRAGRHMYVDSNMIRAGLSQARLRNVCSRYDPGMIHCHVADEDLAEEAKRSNLPRSLLGVRKARHMLDGCIAVFGNAPTALMELNRLITEENVRPALVVAAPVGFVNVEDSKEELMALDVPHIALSGRRGGSPVAVSIVHALCSLTGRSETNNGQTDQAENVFDTIILLGHGSRVPGADRSMLHVAEQLRSQKRYASVKTCNMSRLGPHFQEVFEDCIENGARRIMLIPYFLNQGLHIKLDIPAMMQKVLQQHPQVKLVLGNGLGFDHLLVQLVNKRIAESTTLCDVRELELPEEEAFPIPQGQCEFVPMAPTEAERWRESKISTNSIDGGKK